MSEGMPSAALSKAVILSLNLKVFEMSGLRLTLPEAIKASARSKHLHNGKQFRFEFLVQ